MKYKLSFYIWTFATLVCMGVIFLFSSFNSEISQTQSSAVAVTVFGSEEIEEAVRTFAHFAIFTVLGFFATNALKHLMTGKKLILTALCFSSVYAMTDEIHQYFVPGRAFEISDWAIDTAGAMLGIAVAYIIKHCAERRKLEPGSNKAQ